MNTGVGEALFLSIAMAAAIFFCRFFPFLFFRKKTDGRSDTEEKILAIVEKTVPPVAMTVLAFNALAGTVQINPRELIPAISAAVVTALLHLWRRNPLISIFGGTALYMLLSRLVLSFS